MKESEIYKLAQLSVLADDRLFSDQKLDILHELMNREDLAKLCERREAEEA